MSKIKIKTSELQNLIDIVGVCALNNTFSNMSGLIDLTVSNNSLKISATDGNNYIYVHSDINASDFSICVKIDQLLKLIPKLTSEFVELENESNNLTIVSNGTYKIPTLSDENGNSIKIEDKLVNYDFKDGIEVSTVDIAVINTANKNAISKNNGIIEYTGYYFSDTAVITTDGVTLAKYNKNIFNKTILLNKDTFDLLTMFNTNFKAYIEDDYIIFKNDKISIYASFLPGKENYQIDKIDDLFNTKINNSCSLNKKLVLDALNRISIFIDNYDMNYINVIISNNKIRFSTKNKVNFEEIVLSNSSFEDVKEFEIDIIRFINILNQLRGDEVNLYYGDNPFIKIFENNVTQLLAISN